MIAAFVTGFATGFSLILAIGAQNAFVLRQGLIGAHVLPLCLLCAFSDAMLIAAGVAGFGMLVTRMPWFPDAMAIAGAAFLIGYAILRLRAAVRGDYRLVLEGQSPGLTATLLTGAAFTWLNPHVYLDTLGLVGAVSTQFTDEAKVAFGGGAVLASFVFFLSLGYGARWLAPVMQSPRAWLRLDLLIAATMGILASSLIRSVFV